MVLRVYEMSDKENSAKVETYKERKLWNPIVRWLDKRMDKMFERETAKYIKQYATNEDGTVDEYKAGRIRMEMARRNQMGREIDVYEPLRWATYSGILGVFTGGAAKVVHEHYKGDEINYSGVKNALIATTFTSFAASFLIIGRIFSLARFKAGLYAAAQVAISTPGQVIKSDGTHEHDGKLVASLQTASPANENRQTENSQLPSAALLAERSNALTRN